MARLVLLSDRSPRDALPAVEAIGLDVKVEPLGVDSPLRKLRPDQMLLSPHSAAYTEGGELQQGVAWATRSVVTALNGSIPDNVYNREVIPRWKERFGGASATSV